MKKLIISVVVVLVVAIGGYIYQTKPCLAGMCYGGCVNSSYCPDGCACIKSEPGVGGKCRALNRADQLIK